MVKSSTGDYEMNLNDYQRAATKTALYDQSMRYWYPTLGIIGEFGEYLATDKDEDAHKELGDVCWYASALATDLGLELQYCYDSAYLGNEWMVNEDCFYRLAELVKKVGRNDNFDWAEQKKEQAAIYLGQIIHYIEEYAFDWDKNDHIPISNILQQNIDKLYSRMERGVINSEGNNR